MGCGDYKDRCEKWVVVIMIWVVVIMIWVVVIMTWVVVIIIIRTGVTLKSEGMCRGTGTIMLPFEF